MRAEECPSRPNNAAALSQLKLPQKNLKKSSIIFAVPGQIIAAMAKSFSSLLSVYHQSKERWSIWVLCVFSAIHVLVFSAAFPFFNNVDEPYHFDLVVKYSHLHFPPKPEYVADESLQYIAIFWTWEYLYTYDTLPAPPWKLSESQAAPILLSRENQWRFINYESQQPPLYYLATGAWWKLCGAAGFHDAFLLYLLRFFNVLVVGSLVWLGWWTARLVFPEKIFIRIAVCALVACLPQSIFYSINNDTFSPLVFGAAFFCLLKFVRAEVPSLPLALATGLLLAATFLVKTSNLPLLAVSALMIALKAWSLMKERPMLEVALPLVVLFFGAAGPMTGWMLWCHAHFGSLLGSAQLARQLGWTIKPFSEWWQHPLFTPRGVALFLSGNLATFWQGELTWHAQSLLLPAINIFYTLLSIVFIAGGLLYLKKVDGAQRRALAMALAAVVAVFAFYGFLSIIYDFHDCMYPSRARPYFISGRLLLGALIPFLLLFAFGLDNVLQKLGNTRKFVALAGLVMIMLGAETITNWPVFSSQYNWYNM